MMTKQLYLLLAAPVCSTIIIAILFLLTEPDIPGKDYSFARVLAGNAIEKDTVIDIIYNSYYIAGTSKNRLFLGNVTGYLHLLSTNTGLTDTSQITLRIKEFDVTKFKSPYIKILAPYFYITDGVMPGLFRGKLDTWEAERFMKDSAYFNKIEPMAPEKFVVRAMQASKNQYVLGTLNATPPYLNLVPLLKKQLDGVFCVDGNLLYNHELDQLVYVYFYRNQFLVADPDLNLLYEGKTIDTFSHVQINPVHVSSGKTQMLSAPPKMINGNSTAKGNFLLVNSNIMGKNDDEYLFRRSSVIDVYEMKSGQYRFSFYLPGYNRRSARDFRIVGNKLMVLYEQHIITYSLNEQFFPRRELQNILPDESGT